MVDPIGRTWIARVVAGDSTATTEAEAELERHQSYAEGLIEELVSERDAAVAALATAHQGYNSVVDAKAKEARAVAMEEAARLMEKRSLVKTTTAPDAIRALAHLPPSLVVLPKEALEKVREAMTEAAELFDGEHHEDFDSFTSQPLRAALALLEA